MEIGKINKFIVDRETKLGYVLTIDDSEEEYFLHHNECNGRVLKMGDVISAFLYVDKKNRVAATLFKPMIELREVGLLKVVNVNREIGLFINNGISKDILLPKEDFMNITMNLLDFYSVIDRVSILTSDKDKNIVNLETNGDVLTLKSSSAEIGKVEEKMNITKNNKKDIKISFSAKYMMEALKSFSTEDVEIHFIGEIKPIIIKSKDKEDLTQLVLPIRTY